MQGQGARRRIVIMGAAGRDFHNFNTVYREDPAVEVVAFTAAQIPGIAGRRYPAELAGPLYPAGIPILPEEELPRLVAAEGVDRVVFAYSDIAHVEVMHRASAALAAGADFVLLGPKATMLQARIPVISICAVRTGIGKSQTARYLSRLLRERGLRAAVVRHPMPYGDLAAQAVQRFAGPADLDAANCTLEEREEYEPHLAAGSIVYAGVDYARILEQAQAEADLILWDGGNNDFAFYRPDLSIVLVDSLRPGQEAEYHPGETVLRMADLVLVAKANAAGAEAVAAVTASARRLAPRARILRAGSRIRLDAPQAVAGRRVAVIEDGPTITHGGMPHGAGHAAAQAAGAAEILDPRPFAVGRMAEVFAQYPHIGRVLPAMGYSGRELADLRATLAAMQAELAVAGTPAELGPLLADVVPVVRARYDYEELEKPGLAGALDAFLQARGQPQRGRRPAEGE